ncbi:MAG: hypothetical protein QXV17_10775 [Candidatus Micrarchaeaceae archaeon]
MLPSNTIVDAGSSTAGTIYGGPFTGPDTVLETNLQFLNIDKDVVLQDAIAQLSNGTAPTQAHAYLISVGNLQNVVAILYSTQLPPNSQYRKVPKLLFKAGQTVFFRAVQLSEASTAAAEATQLVLMWA